MITASHITTIIFIFVQHSIPFYKRGGSSLTGICMDREASDWITTHECTIMNWNGASAAFHKADHTAIRERLSSERTADRSASAQYYRHVVVCVLSSQAERNPSRLGSFGVLAEAKITWSNFKVVIIRVFLMLCYRNVKYIPNLSQSALDIAQSALY